MNNMKMLNDKKEVQEHSKIKVQLYRELLKEHLPLFCNLNYITHVVVCEPFAGPGIYEGGIKGSPIIAKEIIEGLVRKYNKNIFLLLNEKGKENYDILVKNIGKSELIYIENSDANNALKALLNNKSLTTVKAQKLFFVDPFGYSENSVADYDVLDKIFNLKNSESIFFVPISHIKRFMESDSKQADPIKKFLDWRNVDNSYKSTKELSSSIVESFRKEGFYCYDFELKAGSNKYYVYYLGKHIRGASKFLNARDKVDISYKETQRNGDLFGGQQRDILENILIDKFEKDLTGFLKEIKTNREVYKYGVLKGYRDAIQNKTFKKLYNKNKIVIYDLQEKLIDKSNFYLNWTNYQKEPKIKIKWKE